MIKLNGSWRNLFENSDSWKKVVLPVLNRFTFASPNSFVEEKQFSLVWHYRNVPDNVGFCNQENRSVFLKIQLLHLA
ncbi:MAG: hypothetical protein IPF75_14780 [Bacteroidetes bacterium]|nr:hypothetical protein [Bacteroidota bacterium]